MLWGERRGQWHHRRSSQIDGGTNTTAKRLEQIHRNSRTQMQHWSPPVHRGMSESSKLVAPAIVPGVERQPLKKLAMSAQGRIARSCCIDKRKEAAPGRGIERIAVAFEAGRDDFSASAGSRNARCSKPISLTHPAAMAYRASTGAPRLTDLTLELLKRAFLNWLPGERDHSRMVAIPTLAQEDAEASPIASAPPSLARQAGSSTG